MGSTKMLWIAVLSVCALSAVGCGEDKKADAAKPTGTATSAAAPAKTAAPAKSAAPGGGW